MKTKAKRFSSEYTMLTILEYLCLYSKNTPISKYHIMNKITAIRQQRPDRISLILNRLEENEYIKSTTTMDTSSSSSSSFTNPTTTKLYLVTEKGFDAYLKWIKEFLSFVRSMNNEDHTNE